MKILCLGNNEWAPWVFIPLKTRGHDVTVVKSVQEGIGYIDGGNDFRLVVILQGASTGDNNLLDAANLARNIRARQRQMPIILFTDRPTNSRSLVEVGVYNKVVARPFTVDGLVQHASELGIQL